MKIFVETHPDGLENSLILGTLGRFASGLEGRRFGMFPVSNVCWCGRHVIGNATNQRKKSSQKSRGIFISEIEVGGHGQICMKL